MKGNKNENDGKKTLHAIRRNGKTPRHNAVLTSHTDHHHHVLIKQ